MSEKKQSSPEPAALALQLCSWQRATPALQGPIPCGRPELQPGTEHLCTLNALCSYETSQSCQRSGVTVGLTHPCRVGGWAIPGLLQALLLSWGAACSGWRCDLQSSHAVPWCPLLQDGWDGKAGRELCS